jgi:hypothetical protein
LKKEGSREKGEGGSEILAPCACGEQNYLLLNILRFAHKFWILNFMQLILVKLSGILSKNI